MRRSPATGELAYYLAWAPGPQPLTALVRVADSRWSIEETFQAGKGQVGLDHYQVRGWTPWHRFITLAMLALAFLAVLTASNNDPTAADTAVASLDLRDSLLPSEPLPAGSGARLRGIGPIKVLG